MAFIVGKKQDGKTYYYLAESARVDGKPRIVSQRYLGSAEEIAQRLSESGPGEPDRSRHLAFGDIAAVWEMLARLQVAEIIDEVVGARRSDAGASIGTYIALATLNRVVDPCSKLAFSEWWAKTAGDRWLRLPPGALDHRRFWEAMDAIDEDDLREIERRIVAAMVETFALDLSGLVLDMTNFATWIDSGNEKAPIAQRGHSKQKRNDLRICGLGLVVSRDGGVPLVSHAYPGNKPDVTQFGAMVTELATRFEALVSDDAAREGARLTLVYDAGQNSDDNYTLLDGSPLSFVGSLPPSDHPDLLAVGKDRYAVVDHDRFRGLVAFETKKVVFGKERRLVCCHSDGLHEKQSRGFDQTLAKANRQLTALEDRLARGRTRKSREKVEAEIAAILAPRWVSQVIAWTLDGESPAELRLSFHTKQAARAALEERLFGKRILFTDKSVEEASTAQIVAEYRSQETVEGDFRQMKDPKVVSFSPMFHWTESKIRVHVFYCVLALMVAKLMVREADRVGMHLSVRELLGTVAGIEETVLLYQGERGRPRARRMLTEQDATQRRLYELFGLDAYAPKR
ncbi:MAG: IS1634 family transposase [Actinomycetota bacterium]|jgi:transposase|nr:IS1634 family transposase [Actinomycetota bacterium]